MKLNFCMLPHRQRIRTVHQTDTQHICITQQNGFLNTILFCLQKNQIISTQSNLAILENWLKYREDIDLDDLTVVVVLTKTHTLKPASY